MPSEFVHTDSQCRRSSISQTVTVLLESTWVPLRNVCETLGSPEASAAEGHEDVGMPRVDLLQASQAPLTAQQYFSDGDPGPIVAALAQVPELLGPTLGFVGAALGQGATPVRLKEFAILRTSVLQGCQYCIHSHTAVSLDVGLSVQEVKALRGEIPIEDGFGSESERALIGWIDSLAGSTGAIPDDVWVAARKHWPEHLLIELTVTVGATMFLNRFATGFQLPTAAHVSARLEAVGLQ